MTGNNDDDYKVGKGRPPMHSRFKPRQSGNPSGRPKKKSAAYKDTLERALTKKVPFVDSKGVKHWITLDEAQAMALVTNAAKGRVGSQKLLDDQRRHYGLGVADDTVDETLSDRDAAALQDYLDRMARPSSEGPPPAGADADSTVQPATGEPDDKD